MSVLGVEPVQTVDAAVGTDAERGVGGGGKG